MIKAWLAAGGLVALLWGAALLLPEARRGRRIAALAERTWRVERFVYRRHRLFGSIVVAGAITWIAFLAFHATHWQSSRLVELVGHAAWAFAVFALVIGLYLVVRPSAMKNLEALANRWIEPLPLSGSSRLAAGFLIAAGIACLLAAAWLG